MALTEVTTRSDRKIFLEALYMVESYAGNYCGNPTLEYHLQLLTAYKNIATRIWPKRPILVPEEKRYFSDFAILPRFWLIGEFTCVQPVRDPQYDGSFLLLMWFQASLHPIIDEHSSQVIASLDWQRFASDFLL